ncbi:HTH-type transcriptional regulatory protein GabR [compost metagenome]
MVLPEQLVPLYHELRRDIMFEASSSRIHQRTLQLFMQKGYFEQHVRRMRKVYRRKNEQLVASLQHHFSDHITILGHHAGMHLVVQIHSEHSEVELLNIAKEAGIRVASAAFYWNTRKETEQKTFIIGFGGISIELIDEGISLLREVWSPYLLKQK